jgi:hypothetical protein
MSVAVYDCCEEGERERERERRGESESTYAAGRKEFK